MFYYQLLQNHLMSFNSAKISKKVVLPEPDSPFIPIIDPF